MRSKRIGRDDDVGARGELAEFAAARGAVVPDTVTTVRSGANRAASAAQLATTLAGATIRNGSRPPDPAAGHG